MTQCFIEKCRNNEGTDRYFQFPNDEIILDKWKRFCQCENINPNTARLCWAHFTEEDFQNLTEYEMGTCKQLLLKTDACPSIMACSRNYNVQKECEINCNGREQVEVVPNMHWVKKVVKSEYDKMSNKEKDTFGKSVVLGLNIFEGYQQELTEPLLPLDSMKTTQPVEDKVVDVSTFNLIQKVGEKIMETKSLEEIIAKLRLENFKLVSQIEKSKKIWHNQLLRESFIEKSMKKFLTKSQIQKFKSGKDRCQFSDADYEKFLHLFFLSSSTYNLLLHWNYPFPSRRAMQRYIQVKNINGVEFLKAARKQYISERAAIKKKKKSPKENHATEIEIEIDENNMEMQIDEQEAEEEEKTLENSKDSHVNDSTTHTVTAIEIESQLNEHGMDIQVQLKPANDLENEANIVGPSDVRDDIEIDNQQNDDDLEIRLDEYFSVID